MNRFDVFETEYKDSIQKAYDSLDEYDKLLIGELVAVVRRSDLLLGRPVESLGNQEDTIYAIYRPSKSSSLTQTTLKVIIYENIKLISLIDFVNSLNEYNFSYMQIILNDDAIIDCTNQFSTMVNLYRSFINIDNISKMAFRKMVSLSVGILGDIVNRKFKTKEQYDNRLFLLLESICICNNYINTKRIDLMKLDSDPATKSLYDEYIKDAIDLRCCFSSDTMNWLKSEVGGIMDFEAKVAPKMPKDYSRVMLLTNSSIMLSIFE